MAVFSLYLSSCHQSLGFRAKKYSKTRIIRGNSVIRCKSSRLDQTSDEEKGGKRKLKILIAGGGIGGLVLALAAKHRGFQVQVFEKDSSSVRGEGKGRGPIQLVSSALAVLEAIDEDVVKQIMEAGCDTGNRINGYADGVSGEWFTKFDLSSPAVSRGLPITQVICRMELLDILVNAVGSDILRNKSKVVDFIQDPNKVTVILEDGQRYDGDVLVGADGIWSKVRSKLFGIREARYSNYTCYSGLTKVVPSYVNSVGYRIFLGANQYFGAVEVGHGNMQWLAFHKQPPMSTDPPEGKKKRLLEVFGKWCQEVVALIQETPESMILQRDIFDRDMIYSWGTGRVALLGDAAHPLQPNLGIGGCMAVEDSYQLVDELDQVSSTGSDAQRTDAIVLALRRYATKRMRRVGIVHAATRMAPEMLAMYRPCIEFKIGPLAHLSTLKIMHPAFPMARAFLQFCMPEFMTWIITGHGLSLKGREKDPSYKQQNESQIQ
ncbi:hypothetical protein ACFX1R_041496 [Malus domestica]|uniref:zeaxanthin epoxidase, chloroplastic-like n=1 Tax=Malus domestica TaxID=3750 RepID=UPI0039754787